MTLTYKGSNPFFTGNSVTRGIILGAKASGLRDSICCRVSSTVSSYSGLLKHPWQAQDSAQ